MARKKIAGDVPHQPEGVLKVGRFICEYERSHLMKLGFFLAVPALHLIGCCRYFSIFLPPVSGHGHPNIHKYSQEHNDV